MLLRFILPIVHYNNLIKQNQKRATQKEALFFIARVAASGGKKKLKVWLEKRLCNTHT